MGTNAEKHARQKENRDWARAQSTGLRGRRRGPLIAGVVILLLVIIALVAFLSREDDTTATTSSTSTTVAPVELPAPAEGITLTEETPCPPAEGTAKRVQVFAGPPPRCIDPSAFDYSATFSTSEGDFTATLDAQAAPVTVNNFVVLARYHFYDSVPFHRIAPGFVIQAGDGDGEPWGNNDLGYQIDDELPADSSAYADYALAMANAGANTNGSQFFVVLPGGGARLEPNFSYFGQVIEGMDVVDTIGGFADGETPTKVVLINTVTITETPKS